MNRALLALFLLVPLAAQAPAKASLQVHFLSATDGRKALTEGAEAGYLEQAQLGDLRAKTGLALEGLTLAQARERARQHFAGEVQTFTPDEEAMIRGVLERLTPALAERLPLMARTPFSFLKVSPAVEGGLPHTRGDHIVLSPLVLAPMVGLHQRKAFAALDGFAASLFVHEQAHVLERRHPDRFRSLYTEVFGFKALPTLPDHPWLAERRVVNPDGPDVRWAFPIKDGGHTGWMRPDLILTRLDRPRMPQDFRMVAVQVEEKAGRWEVVLDEHDHPAMHDLAHVPDYVAAFPNPDEFYHPHEIAADLLAALVTGRAEGKADHPLRARTAAWVKAHLN